MQLYNAGSMFNEKNMIEFLSVANNPEKLKEKNIEAKKLILKSYNFKAYNLPDDFSTASYIIASNHLTDMDAPLIMSWYYEVMQKFTDIYPAIFVFAKENCFNGVSIPQELTPVLNMENVYAVDRNKLNGSFDAIRAAKKWFTKDERPKHFLIFSQGTIYDINKDSAEDIEKGAFWLAQLLGIQVLPAFIEQAVEGLENRMVFGKPITVPKYCRDFDEHKKLWLERVIEAQNSLLELSGFPAREVTLDEQHKIRKKVKPS